MPPRVPLVLASTSRYRRELLARLGLAFETVAPRVDEAALPGESPAQTARRLAAAKAEAVAAQCPSHWVIGADQVAALGDQPINKPESHAAAVGQLARLSGREAEFHSALCLRRIDGEVRELAVVTTRVRYRALGGDAIASYLAREAAYDCAGSARIEGLGITLVEWVRGDDPSALVGLPLITLSGWLRRYGLLPA